MGLWSDTLSLLFLPPLLQGSLPTGGSSPWASPKCILPQGCSSSWTAPAWVPSSGVELFRNGLLQHGTLSESQILPVKPLQLHSPQGHRCCQKPATAQAPKLPQASTCSGVGSSTPCRWRSAPPQTSTGTSCLIMVRTMGCNGISAPVPKTPLPPPSSLPTSAELFLSHIPPFSHSSCYYPGLFPLS